MYPRHTSDDISINIMSQFIFHYVKTSPTQTVLKVRNSALMPLVGDQTAAGIRGTPTEAKCAGCCLYKQQISKIDVYEILSLLHCFA